MSMRETRKKRRENSRAALRSVAAAPSFKAVKKKRATRSPLRRAALTAAALSILFVGTMATPKVAKAGTPPPTAPEIDPTSMAGALTLLVGGFLVMTDRARRS